MTTQPGRYLHITSRPGIAGGEPCFSLKGTRVVDLLDRIDAGDSIKEVAKDFSVETESLELLLELREQVRGNVLDALADIRETGSWSKALDVIRTRIIEPQDRRLAEAEEIIRECDSPDGFCGEMPDETRDRIEAFLATAPTQPAVQEAA